MKTRLLIIIGLIMVVLGVIFGFPFIDAFKDEGSGSIMDISNNVISPEQTMFINGTFDQPSDYFTANIFKNYEDSRELVLTLNPSTNEFGDFAFNFTIPQDWKLGNYYIVLENGHQEMDWQFAVRNNHAGNTLDRTGSSEYSTLNYEIISWDELSLPQNDRTVIYTKNTMIPLGILEKGQQYSIVQKVDFRDDNFAENSSFDAVVGYAYQKGDKMVHPPRGENVTDADHQEFAQKTRKQNNEFYQHNDIGNSFEFEISPEKPFYVKSYLSFDESGLYTHQYYKKLKNSPAVISSNMGSLAVVDKFSKAVDENGVCKNDDFRRLIKHDYSTVVCVEGSTAHMLIDRGWGL